jgi:hypothetical protein
MMLTSEENLNLLQTENEGLTDDQWLEMIGDRVQWFLDNDKDLLLSYMYRLDIEENKINHALTPMHAEPAHILLARLIFERQKQRIATKKSIKVDPIEGWEF